MRQGPLGMRRWWDLGLWWRDWIFHPLTLPQRRGEGSWSASPGSSGSTPPWLTTYTPATLALLPFRTFALARISPGTQVPGCHPSPSLGLSSGISSSPERPLFLVGISEILLWHSAYYLRRMPENLESTHLCGA